MHSKICLAVLSGPKTRSNCGSFAKRPTQTGMRTKILIMSEALTTLKPKINYYLLQRLISPKFSKCGERLKKIDGRAFCGVFNWNGFGTSVNRGRWGKHKFLHIFLANGFEQATTEYQFIPSFWTSPVKWLERIQLYDKKVGRGGSLEKFIGIVVSKRPLHALFVQSFFWFL